MIVKKFITTGCPRKAVENECAYISKIYFIYVVVTIIIAIFFTSLVHLLLNIDYTKSFVDIVSRHFATSLIYHTVVPPSHVKV